MADSQLHDAETQQIIQEVVENRLEAARSCREMGYNDAAKLVGAARSTDTLNERQNSSAVTHAEPKNIKPCILCPQHCDEVLEMMPGHPEVSGGGSRLVCTNRTVENRFCSRW